MITFITGAFTGSILMYTYITYYDNRNCLKCQMINLLKFYKSKQSPIHSPSPLNSPTPIPMKEISPELEYISLYQD